MHRASHFINPVLFNASEAVVSKEQFFLPGSKNLTFTTSCWLYVHKTKCDAKINFLHFILPIISFLLHPGAFTRRGPQMKTLYYGPNGLKFKEYNNDAEMDQLEVECPETIVRKEEEMMDLDIVINHIQNKHCL